MTPKKFARVYNRAVVIILVSLFVVFLPASFIFDLEVGILLPFLIVMGIINVFSIFAFWKCPSCRKTLPMDESPVPGFSPNTKIDSCPNCRAKVE